MTETTESELISREFVVESITAATADVLSTMPRVGGHTGPERRGEGGDRAVLGPGVPDRPGGSLGGNGKLGLLRNAGVLAGLSSAGESVRNGERRSVGRCRRDHQYDSGQREDDAGRESGSDGSQHADCDLRPQLPDSQRAIHAWTVVPFTIGSERLLVQLCVAPNEEKNKTTLRPGFQMPHILTV